MTPSGEPTITSWKEPQCRANLELVGRTKRPNTRCVALSRSGRIRMRIPISGPRGIGKATLAFRLARFVLAHLGGASEPAPGEGLAIPSESGVFRRVAAGGHADLLTVERAYDPRRKRLRTEIVVDDAREIATFLHLTPAEGGWRVVVVDGADEMNRSAANALLKILEEPPRRALLLLAARPAPAGCCFRDDPLALPTTAAVAALPV